LTIDGNSFQLSHKIDTPTLLLDIDIFQDNVLSLLEICRQNNVSLQPHAKTHRVAQLGAFQQRLGCDGLCVAKVGEAENFANAGIKKITIAYPVVGESKIVRVRELAKKIDVSLAVDSVEGARQIGDIFFRDNLTCKIFMIINSGLNRDGVSPHDAVKMALSINTILGIQLIGILTHEGSVYGSSSHAELLEASVNVSNSMVTLAHQLVAAGIKIQVVSMGASASAKTAATTPGINQIRPGIFAFNDLGQIALGNATPATTAVRVVATVVSRPSPHTAVIDAGSKTLSADLLPAKAFRDLYPGYGLIVGKSGWVIDRLSEEHGVLTRNALSTASELSIGEQLQIIPNHVCTVFSSLNECTAISRGEISAIWRTFSPGASR